MFFRNSAVRWLTSVVLAGLLVFVLALPEGWAKPKKQTESQTAGQAKKVKKAKQTEAEKAAAEKAAAEKAEAEKAAAEKAAAEKAAALAASPPPDVTRSIELADCRKCHPEVVEAVAKRGRAHRDKVTCLNCHEQHRPLVETAVPRCTKCHADRPHFKLDGCLGCHLNPHTPRVIELDKTITAPCLTCHPEQGAELRDNPSFHSRLECTSCHQARHGRIPECFKCHKPHTDTMTNAECGLCHQAHKPLVIAYGKDIRSESCGSCHARVFGVLARTGSRHRGVACADCHVERHGSIPECGMCHGQPHARQIHERYGRCGECHGVAHDLVATERGKVAN